MLEGVILCVDDEETILSSLQMQLEKMFDDRFVLEFAISAEDALDILDDHKDRDLKVLVIISDWLMPQMKGDEFLIKAHGAFPKIVKIMLSGQADKKAIQNAVDNANLYRFLDKPWTQEQLQDAIEGGLRDSGF